MSLDLYIITKNPIKIVGTGIYVRDSGKTKELKTLEEVKKYFPNIDPEKVKVTEIETDTYWEGNMTHNLWKMASQVISDKDKKETLYDLLWKPNEHGYQIVTEDYINKINMCYYKVYLSGDELKKYNPPNGWGSYEGFLEFLDSYRQALENIRENLQQEEYQIMASV